MLLGLWIRHSMKMLRVEGRGWWPRSWLVLAVWMSGQLPTAPMASTSAVPQMQRQQMMEVPSTEGKRALNILSYNMYGVFGWWGTVRRRTAQAVTQGFLQPYDVLVFQELFQAGHVRDFLRLVQGRGHPHCTKVLNRSGYGFRFSGGVVVCSRYPFARRSRELLFTQSASWDRFAAKGALYVAIRKGGQRYHIVGTHTQAGNDAGARGIRSAQLQQMRRWIKGLAIPADEPLFVVGDMNIPKYRGDQREYRWMKRFLQVDEPLEQASKRRTRDTPTFDPVNNQLAGGTTPMVLDYILYATGYRRPKATSFKRVLPLPFSDHYAVHGHFVF